MLFACGHVATLPINIDWVQVQVCPSKWIDNKSPAKFVHACKIKTNSWITVCCAGFFFFNYMEMVSNTHCRHGGLTSHAVCGKLPVSCVVLQRRVLDPSVLVSCVRIQYTVCLAAGVSPRKIPACCMFLMVCCKTLNWMHWILLKKYFSEEACGSNFLRLSNIKSIPYTLTRQIANHNNFDYALRVLTHTLYA